MKKLIPLIFLICLPLAYADIIDDIKANPASFSIIADPTLSGDELGLINQVGLITNMRILPSSNQIDKQIIIQRSDSAATEESAGNLYIKGSVDDNVRHLGQLLVTLTNPNNFDFKLTGQAILTPPPPPDQPPISTGPPVTAATPTDPRPPAQTPPQISAPTLTPTPTPTPVTLPSPSNSVVFTLPFFILTGAILLAGGIAIPVSVGHKHKGNKKVLQYYIQQARSRRYTDPQIYQKLQQSGWHNEMITEAFKAK